MLALANVLVLVTGAGYFTLVERRVTRSGPPGPLFCSIYDRCFWRRERCWKAPSAAYLQILGGTPFKNVLWPLLGVRIGRRVFDDGAAFTERTMVTVGDGCTLNAGRVVQCHSQEDGTFKSDRSTLGAGCTLGVGALVHYGVTVGEGAVLAPDSFLMKGEDVPPSDHRPRLRAGRPAAAVPAGRRTVHLERADPRRGGRTGAMERPCPGHRGRSRPHRRRQPPRRRHRASGDGDPARAAAALPHRRPRRGRRRAHRRLPPHRPAADDRGPRRRARHAEPAVRR